MSAAHDTANRDHLVLVPGFGGFDALGAIDYFAGVIPPLREVAPFSIHLAPSAPGAPLRTRATVLAVFLGRLIHRGTIREGDAIHLVAHSTGGLAVRQMLHHLLRKPERIIDQESFVPSGEILGAVRSVQYLSVPHRGTTLADQLAAVRLPLRLAARIGSGALRAGGPALAAAAGRALRRLLPDERDIDLVDAVLDTLADLSCDTDASGRARARARYDTLLGWLQNLASGSSAIDELRPAGPGAARTADTPARWPGELLEHERAFYDRIGGRVRSIVTAAHIGHDSRLAPISWLLWLSARNPQPALGRERTVAMLLDERRSVELELGSSDGIVSSVSMVWPDARRSRFVWADHGDLIGHYTWSGAPTDYDLLRSRPALSSEAFADIWREVGRFALQGWEDRQAERPERSTTEQRRAPTAELAIASAE